MNPSCLARRGSTGVRAELKTALLELDYTFGWEALVEVPIQAEWALAGVMMATESSVVAVVVEVES